jgi:hypothetical protein
MALPQILRCAQNDKAELIAERRGSLARTTGSLARITGSLARITGSLARATFPVVILSAAKDLGGRAAVRAPGPFTPDLERHESRFLVAVDFRL